MGILSQVSGIRNSRSSFDEQRQLTAGSLPVGSLAILLLLLAIPPHFPYHARNNSAIGKVFTQSNLKRLDFLGAALLLCSSFSLVAALLEASIRYSWTSAITIVLMVVSGLCWTAFFACEWFFTSEKRKPEPIFPWRFLYHAPWMGMLVYDSLFSHPSPVIPIRSPLLTHPLSRTGQLSLSDFPSMSWSSPSHSASKQSPALHPSAQVYA